MNVSELVLEVVQKLGKELDNKELMTPSPETRIFGAEGLNSIALVTLIVDLEDALAKQLQRPIVLADESAMSRFHSPFRTVGTLIAHVQKVVELQK